MSIFAATGAIVLLATATAYPSTIPKRLAIDLEPVATGLTAPNWGAMVPGCPGLADRLVVM
jgi:hypothetical protein